MAEIYHFAITAIQYLICVPGVTVIVTTDTPCHLYMRWTNQLPLIHLDPYIRRGVAVGTRPRYCFDLYRDNEQFETGDSLTHTFIKPTWTCCETRYFYFWGCKFGYLMPSETTIFEYHNRYLDPVDVNCPYINNGNFLQGSGISWLLAKTNYNGYSICPHNPEAQCLLVGATYYCSRTAFSFDTSMIPLGSYICSANLRVYDATSFSHLIGHGDYWVYLVDGNLWTEDCATHWFPTWHSWQDICAHYYIPLNKAWGCKLYPITDLGLTRIICGGHTKYVVKLHYDYEEIPPIDTTDYYRIAPFHGGCLAQLQIKYCPPC